MNYIYLDFEFNQTTEKQLNVVCVSVAVYKKVKNGQNKIQEMNLWLENHPANRDRLIRWLEKRRKDSVFIAYAAQAEARAIDSLGFDPLLLKWIDLYLEYRMLTNHWHKYAYGKQLTKKSGVKVIRPPKPKYQRTEEDNYTSPKPETGLVAAVFKLLGERIDQDYKKEMRDLIIAGGREIELHNGETTRYFSREDKEKIMDYCMEDVRFLPQLYVKIFSILYNKLEEDDRANLKDHMHLRAEYAVRSSIMERIGYPIDFEATKNFSASVNSILCDVSSEIARNFPDITPFLINRDGTKWVQKQKNIREWVKAQGFDNWLKTDKGSPSLSLEAFTRYFDFKHDYPQDNFGAQMVRFLKTKQSLNGFMPPKKGSRNFWDYVGSDGRVRPYMGIYGAQSARSQPAATGFIPLKSAWMRSLIKPPPGRVICSVDYSQQEFLVAALLSEDEDMIDSYHSGDPYFHNAKLANAVPWESTREEYPEIRDKFKSTALGIQYMMGSHGLAGKLTRDTGKPHTVEDAEALIGMFEASYPEFIRWRDQIWAAYRRYEYLILPCGWVMFGDNFNRKSVGNFPIQGYGSSIMRKAVALAQDSGLDVIFTLHDALYIEADVDDLDAVDRLGVCMDEAFRYYFSDEMKEFAQCRMDPAIWGPDLKDGDYFHSELMGETPLYSTYIDPRSKDEYLKFKKYFTPQHELGALHTL